MNRITIDILYNNITTILIIIICSLIILIGKNKLTVTVAPKSCFALIVIQACNHAHKRFLKEEPTSFDIAPLWVLKCKLTSDRSGARGWNETFITGHLLTNGICRYQALYNFSTLLLASSLLLESKGRTACCESLVATALAAMGQFVAYPRLQKLLLTGCK